MRKVLFVFACLFAFGLCPAQADGGKVYKYTYELGENGHHFCDVEDIYLPDEDVRVVEFLLGWRESTGCMLSMRITDFFKSNRRSPAAVLGKQADVKGNEDGIWSLNGSLTLSNGEVWSVRPFLLNNAWKEDSEGIPGMGITDFALVFGRVSSSSKTALGGMSKVQRNAYVADRLSKYDISNFTVGGYTFSLESIHTAPTMRAVLRTLRSKTGADAWFDYSAAPQARQPVAPQRTPQVQQPQVQQPSAQITRFDMEHNVKKQGRTGANIVFSCSLRNLAGRTLQASAFFYREDGSVLMDANRNFYTISTGQVSVNTNLAPTYAASRFTDVRMFIPYGELHLPAGRHSLKVKMSIFDIATGQELAQSDFVHFYWEK